MPKAGVVRPRAKLGGGRRTKTCSIVVESFFDAAFDAVEATRWAAPFLRTDNIYLMRVVAVSIKVVSGPANRTNLGIMLANDCVMISSQSSRLARPAFHILQRSGCSSLGSVGGWCGSRVFSEFSDSRSFSSRSGRTERMWNNVQQLSGRNNAGRPSVCLSTSRPMSTRAKRDFYQVLGVSKSADKVSTALQSSTAEQHLG